MVIRQPVWCNGKLWALAFAETFAWAGIFYMFPALLIRWEDHFGWGLADLSLGFTVALVASALTSIFGGRLIDRGWSRQLMSGSVLSGGVLILLLPFVDSLWQFYFTWALVGAAMGGCLYQPCFSYLTYTFKEDAKRPIIMVTLVAGFASTISYPASTLISNSYGWESAIYVFSFVQFFVAAPLFWYGASIEIPESSDRPIEPPISVFVTFRTLTVNPVFWGLLITFTAFALNQGMIVSQIFPLLESRGLSPTQIVFFASCVGPMQVLARLILFLAESFVHRNISMTLVCLVSLLCLGSSSLSLALGEESIALVAVFVMMQGGPYGLVSIIRPVITAELLGRTNFGVMSAIVVIGGVWGTAFAPGIAGAIAERWSYDAVLMSASVIVGTGLISIIGVLVRPRAGYRS